MYYPEGINTTVAVRTGKADVEIIDTGEVDKSLLKIPKSSSSNSLSHPNFSLYLISSLTFYFL